MGQIRGRSSEDKEVSKGLKRNENTQIGEWRRMGRKRCLTSEQRMTTSILEQLERLKESCRREAQDFLDKKYVFATHMVYVRNQLEDYDEITGAKVKTK